MSKTFNFLRGTAVALFLATPAFADDSPNAETVVATVNGTEITLGQMVAVRETLEAQYQQLPADVLFNGILDQLVQQTMLAGTYGGDTPKRVELALENMELALMSAEVMREVIDAKVTEDAIQAAYDAQYAGFEGAPEFNASHILVEDEDAAMAITQEIRDGADFAETAKAKSTGPSGPNGGELGWFGPGQMVPEFEGAVVNMEVGTVSDPVQTQFGWHVIKLNDARKQSAPSLDAVRGEIVGQVQRDVVDAEVARLTEIAEVDKSASEGIDPALLTNTDLLEN